MKKTSIILLSFILIILSLIKGLEWMIEMKFQATINSNPNRAYDITYSNFDLDSFFKGVTLDKLKITPLIKDEGTIIDAHVSFAKLDGMSWINLLLGRELKINEIAFEQPIFKITTSNDTINKTTTGVGMQELFGDILSRGSLNSFRIKDGSVTLLDGDTNKMTGRIKKINISASEIATDSISLTHLIPFEMGQFEIEVDSAFLKVNDFTDFKLDYLHYNLSKKELSMNNVGLNYSIDWVKVSRKIAIQKPLTELNIKELKIENLEPSSRFYSHLDIIAQNITIDELDIKIQKNKNYNRPPDTFKPMFQGIVNAIPIDVGIDAVEIKNSTLTYTELAKNKKESGSLRITDINGLINNITNIPEKKLIKKEISTHLKARLLNQAKIDVSMQVPYGKETFSLAMDIGEMDLTSLNPTINPMLGVEMDSGNLKRIHYEMIAGPRTAENKLIFDYTDLHVQVFSKKNTGKKKYFLSKIGNVAIRKNNYPELKKYRTVSYQTERNIYRSPVNYFISGLIDGIVRVVPKKGIRKIMHKNK